MKENDPVISPIVSSSMRISPYVIDSMALRHRVVDMF